ncbi:hypothetical protein SAMN05660489_04129 [Pseudomonas sp. LAMO17WK12:I10]|nr:hypothetical protein H160_04217 [Pseudomonas sp. LAMO17WK12:I9]SNY43548.1 hypothetical protein SAMN05660489_04129 [Pseudomonas sp. LAMO17WK12:I10]
MKKDIPDINSAHMLLLTLFASHHQKMVLVDYEDTANAVGFVHRNYWDTSAFSSCSHSFLE